MNKKIGIIGSGFSGLAAASVAAAGGAHVTVFEKNSSIGGRARTFRYNSYLFDMGPSWYWMPDVFENFFGLFGKKVSDYYQLKRLDPGFCICFGEDDFMDVPASLDGIYDLFERIEEGSSEKLEQFLAEAKVKYDVAFRDLIYKPSLSVLEFLQPAVIKGAMQLDVFTMFDKHVRKFFKDDRLISLMEFPILFLGGSAENIPSLYSLMNYAALSQGTFYPMGGFSKITEGMYRLAADLGVNFHTDAPVTQIEVRNNSAHSLTTPGGKYVFDGVIASADYAHAETLLPEDMRNYSDRYWDKKVLSPSCLIYYIGVNRRVPKLRHHTLFFDRPFKPHSDEIYKKPKWPTDPLFYVCCPSRTDDAVAPAGHENLFILMPLAPGLTDNEETREQYFSMILDRLEKMVGIPVRQHIDYKKSYCISNFEQDYNSYKGNAYGLANTLSQTAILKPSLRNKHVGNLFYCGQLTVPGPGVPPALISGQIAAKQLLKHLNK